MSRPIRLLLAVLATVTALVSSVSPAGAVGNAGAAAKAGGYVASQASAASAEVGQAADSLLALAAAKDESLAPQARQLLDTVTRGAGEYAKDAQGAAKLALVADAYGLDARNLGGVDTVAPILAGVKSDGSFGQYPGPYASGLAIVALARAGTTIPEPMVTYLIGGSNSDGGFTYEAGKPSDADNTAMAILGLAAAGDAPGARDALAKAQAWAAANQAADGSWEGYNKVNSTAILGSALQSTGAPQQKAVDYLVSQQASDGSMPGDGKPNLLATQQAVLLLGDTSYADVTASAALMPNPSAAATTAAPTAPAAQDAPGIDPLWWMAALVLLGVVGFVVVRGRRRAREPVAATAPDDPSDA